MKNMRLMKASMSTRLILSMASTLAILLIFANMANSFGSAAFAKGNQSQTQQQGQQNQTGGGQVGKQQQNDTGIGTAQELGNLTGLSNETITNQTNIESPNATTMGGLEKEQTSAETTNLASGGQQNQTQQQQQNQTQKGPLEQLGETLGGIFGGGGGNQSK